MTNAYCLLLCDYTHEKGMDFTATPFDYASADFLEPMVDFYKISSSDLSNLPFVRHIAGKGKTVYLSVGAAYLLGAEVIEKHFTLDKSLPGNDHHHAGDPEDFRRAIANFAWIDSVLGSAEKIFWTVSRSLVGKPDGP